jgi:hypothetical protein
VAEWLPALLPTGVALLCATLALLYARLFVRAARARHATNPPRLWDSGARVLACNDADLYASWRLVRVNIVGALLTLLITSAILTAP